MKSHWESSASYTCKSNVNVEISPVVASYIVVRIYRHEPVTQTGKSFISYLLAKGIKDKIEKCITRYLSFQLNHISIFFIILLTDYCPVSLFYYPDLTQLTEKIFRSIIIYTSNCQRSILKIPASRLMTCIKHSC